jgi:hypothetical protein
MLELIRAQFYAEFPKEDWMAPANILKVLSML